MCYGCGVKVDDVPGNAYCDACIASQEVAEAEEWRTFDAFHAYADRIARLPVGPPAGEAVIGVALVAAVVALWAYALDCFTRRRPFIPPNREEV